MMRAAATRATGHVFFVVTVSSILKAVGHEWLTATSTIVIAFFTATLWWSTRGLLRATNVTVGLARDEFLSTHRPKIRGKHVWLVDELWHGKQLVVNIVCVNNGTTEALITEFGVNFLVIREGRALPHIPKIKSLGIAQLPLACGISLDIPDVSDGTVLTEQEHAAICDGTAKLYCVGFLHYRDKANSVRTTAFCRILVFPEKPGAQVLGRFCIVEDSDYEYED